MKESYFKMKELKTRNIVAYKFRFKYVSLQFFLQLYTYLLWEAPFLGFMLFCS